MTNPEYRLSGAQRGAGAAARPSGMCQGSGNGQRPSAGRSVALRAMWITLALAATPAQAGPMHRPTCAPHGVMVRYLGREASEIPMAFARRTDGSEHIVVEMFVGPMKTWTIVQTSMRDDGTPWSCFVAYGDEFQILAPPSIPGAPA